MHEPCPPAVSNLLPDELRHTSAATTAEGLNTDAPTLFQRSLVIAGSRWLCGTLTLHKLIAFLHWKNSLSTMQSRKGRAHQDAAAFAGSTQSGVIASKVWPFLWPIPVVIE